MSFVKSVGNCLLNGVGFDLYENKNGTATIRPVNRNRDFPKKHWLKFDSIDEANDYIDNFDLNGASLVQKMKQVILGL